MMRTIVTIENAVPFGQTLYTWLHLRDLEFDALVQHGQMEKRYLAWETVRKQVNPYFQTGTGFEGYFVGRCPNPEAALEAILGLSQHILDAIARLYRMEYGFRDHLMRTLTRESGGTDFIQIWAEYLGAELGKLRAQILTNIEAQTFQMRTYRMVESLPPIAYHADETGFTQCYAIGAEGAAPASKLVVTLPMLKPSQQDAWLVAENIGQFGHPLIRRLLEQQTDTRTRM